MTTPTPTPTYTLTDILKNSDYALDVFTPQEIAALHIFDKKGKPYFKDFVDGKERPAKPEEVVRQLFLYRLLNLATYGYPKKRILIEKSVQFGSSVGTKRADIVVVDKDDPETAYIIVEVKKPKRKDGLEQLKSYCNAEGAPIAVWTNGGELVILHREGANSYRSIPNLPRANQTLAEVINEQVTIDELAKRNKLVVEGWTLKSVILDLENLVLANAGVDGFEEVFKLIYAKLFDEWAAENNPSRKRIVNFRATGQTNRGLYDKINGLFKEAQKLWPGVFLSGEKIDLSPAHLEVCVSFLQDLKLFNSNLQVIDEAFEYLVTQVAKGEKGQYFTPRPVIDMAVKMLNPRWSEYVIDTAAGSCGFTVHSVFHVWGGELTSRKPEEWQRNYASEKVYGLDFDARSVKIAKAINLIAGDGKTHVFKLNSLDPRSWDEEARVGLKERLRRFPDDPTQDDLNLKSYRYFDFDIVMTNPPFAGEIKDTRLLHQYDIAKQDDGKWPGSIGRDVLFIERNLDFLKPGGRMAIVLPQGRFNNVSDEKIRRYIAMRCRILAVVGLHINTFKPHTGTKTSVLFLQKFSEEERQERDHYREGLEISFEEAVENCEIMRGNKRWHHLAAKYNYTDELFDAMDDLASIVVESEEDRDLRFWEKTKQRAYARIKTSYVEREFVKKYNYPIFFATSDYPGKGNSGEYIFLNGPDEQPLLDLYGHRIVDQDLYDIREVLGVQLENLLKRDERDEVKCAEYRRRYEQLLPLMPIRPTIAEAFIEFAKAQGFAFHEGN